MGVQVTQLLLLGAVALFEPVNGYQIRRELVSWQVDRWAHVKPGSIYHGLARLTEQGHLARHLVVDGAREVAVYELTETGRTELRRMLRAALITVDPYDSVGFHAAFSMLPLLDREAVLDCLTTRRAALAATLDDFPEFQEAGPEWGPPHAVRSAQLWRDSVATELHWLDEVLADIGAGRLRFALGDDWGWEPPPEDPGWQMAADREKYRALLGR